MELDLIEYDMDPTVKRQVEVILQKLVEKTSAGVVMLTDDAGRIVSIKGKKQEDIESEFLATLISGVFGAAVEMGKILSIDQLEVLQYESKNMDVVIKFIKPRFLLGVIVPKKIAVGTVRLFMKEASDSLEKALESARMVPVRELKIDIKELEEKLNRILGGA